MSSPVEGYNRSQNIRTYHELCARRGIRDASFFDLTIDQQESIHKVCERQGIEKLESVFPPGGILTPYVGLQFTHIFIGIEPDGYAHS